MFSRNLSIILLFNQVFNQEAQPPLACLLACCCSFLLYSLSFQNQVSFSQFCTRLAPSARPPPRDNRCLSGKVAGGRLSLTASVGAVLGTESGTIEPCEWRMYERPCADPPGPTIPVLVYRRLPPVPDIPGVCPANLCFSRLIVNRSNLRPFLVTWN